MTRLLAATTAAAVSLFASAALAQAPTPAAATTFKLGAFEVNALSDVLFVVPNDGKTFGKDPAAVGKMLAAAGKPTETITLGVDALLVKSPGHVMLFDTGVGAPISSLTASLAKAGVTPAEVTDVFITHYHGDHVGGLKGADGKAAFPKATVRMSANEWKAMQADAGSKAVVTAISGQVKAFEPGAEAVPGVTPMALYGHTPGHVVYKISSGGQSIVDIGDTVHSSIVGLAEPALYDAYDTDAAGAIKARAGELKALADGKTLIFAPHFPYPGVGHIVAAGSAYAWAPGVPK